MLIILIDCYKETMTKRYVFIIAKLTPVTFDKIIVRKYRDKVRDELDLNSYILCQYQKKCQRLLKKIDAGNSITVKEIKRKLDLKLTEAPDKTYLESLSACLTALQHQLDILLNNENEQPQKALKWAYYVVYDIRLHKTYIVSSNFSNVFFWDIPIGLLWLNTPYRYKVAKIKRQIKRARYRHEDSLNQLLKSFRVLNRYALPRLKTMAVKSSGDNSAQSRTPSKSDVFTDKALAMFSKVDN